jgi:molybdopterin biosynthesis enzyme
MNAERILRLKLERARIDTLDCMIIAEAAKKARAEAAALIGDPFLNAPGSPVSAWVETGAWPVPGIGIGTHQEKLMERVAAALTARTRTGAKNEG